jgi:glycosyltransferase involved in cell wall biosynthesis
MKRSDTKNPKYSIIIPTYCEHELLMECILSLCEQSEDKSSFEVIVVNDGGNNDISKSLDLFGNRLTLRYFYQQNKGPAAARNLGIQKAKGNIILFLDDDSLPTTSWLNEVKRAWDNFPDLDGIGGYTLSEVTDSIYCRVNSDFFNWYLARYSGDEFHPFLITCNAGYKKAVLNKVDNFDEQFKRASGEDRDLNIKISKIGGKLRLDKSILVYHDRDLKLLAFLKKHYNYGKAAREIYKRYPELGRLSLNDYINLYVSILKRYRANKNKIIAFLLITLSQTCTILGYHSIILSKQE